MLSFLTQFTLTLPERNPKPKKAKTGDQWCDTNGCSTFYHTGCQDDKRGCWKWTQARPGEQAGNGAGKVKRNSTDG